MACIVRSGSHLRLSMRPMLHRNQSCLHAGKPYEGLSLIYKKGCPSATPRGARAFHIPAMVETTISQTCHLITELHVVTHTPWFITIPLVALTVNTCFRLPFTIYAHKVARERLKLSSLLTAWTVRHQRDVDLAIKSGEISNIKKDYEVNKRQRKTAKKLLKQFGLQQWKTQASLAVLPFWLLAIESLRRLCGGPLGLLGHLLGEKPVESSADIVAGDSAGAVPPTQDDVVAAMDPMTAGDAVSSVAASSASSLADPSLATEGCLWFPDLMVSDPYHILPVILSAAMVANVIPSTEAGRRALLGLEDRSASGVQPAGLSRVFLRLQRALLVLAVAIGPVTAALPAGLHLYWISSAFLTYLTGKVVKHFIPVSGRKNKILTGFEIPFIRPPPPH